MPWGISHKYKFVFIHTPRTGGHSILSRNKGSWLNKYIMQGEGKQVGTWTVYPDGILGGGHKRAVEVLSRFKDETKGYFKFTMVRDPFSRFGSAFLSKNIDYQQFENVANDNYLPMVDWVCDSDNNILVDYVARYEVYAHEIWYLAKKVGIDVPNDFPHLLHFNPNIQDKTWGYDKFFTHKVKKFVQINYSKDFKTFNYDPDRVKTDEENIVP